MAFTTLRPNRFAILLLLPLLVAPIGASTYSISIDTTPLSGGSGSLAFDLIDSNPSANTVSISGFATDGTLGTASTVGGPVGGSLPGTVTIADGSFFNELLQDITFGTSLSFDVSLTQGFTAGFLPDSFSFFVLDTSLFPLFPTSDPTFADALFQIDIDGSASGAVLNFAAVDSPPSATWSVNTAVPEPSSILMLLSGLAAVVWRARQRS